MSHCAGLIPGQDQYSYCPSLPASILFAVLFGATTIYHIVQAARLRTVFCWVLIMSGSWQIVAYVVRCLSIRRPYNGPLYNTQFVFILLAPLWTNAFCFVVMGRIINYFSPTYRLGFLTGKRLAFTFVTLDIISFVVQLVGAIRAINLQRDVRQAGLHIYTGGVAMQAFFIICFIGLIIHFSRHLSKLLDQAAVAQGRRLIWILYAALALIMFRIIYRIIEYSGGAGSSITTTILNNEVYQYCFDAMPMFFAIVVFHIIHPGKVLISSRFRTGEGQVNESPNRPGPPVEQYVPLESVQAGNGVNHKKPMSGF